MGQLPTFTLSRAVFTTTTSEQPKGHPGLNSKAEEEGKGRLWSCIGVDLAGILGGRMARAEGGLVPSGVEYGEGCPFFSRLGGLGERHELPRGVRGRAPAENGFWRILKDIERSFLYLYDKICGGQFSLSSLYSIFWGDVSPLCPPP